MKKGFTLIELLAVIVILAIIALIAVPIVVNIINDTKKESLQRSIDLYVDHVQKAITKYQMTHPGFNPKECTIEDKKLTCDGTPIEVEMKGQTPESGTITIVDNKLYYDVELEGMEYILNSEGKQPPQPAPAKATGEDYRGYYADVDGDGEADGIIYADLGANIQYPQTGAFYNEKNNLGQGSGTYSYNKATGNLNEYTISNNTYKKNEGFGDNKIIKLKKDNNNPRFYVMSLEDFTTTDYQTFYWYKNAFEKITEIDTSTDFGKGYENTGKIIEIWNKNGTGAGSYEGATQDNQDIFKHIQEKYNSKEKWYVPSRGEWAAFADYLKKKTTNPLTHNYESGSYVANSGNYKSLYGLSDYYWLSSQCDLNGVWYADFDTGYMYIFTVNSNLSVRLGATF